LTFVFFIGGIETQTGYGQYGYIEGENWGDNFQHLQYKILKEGSPGTKQN
jgi:hypothetical protein